MNESCLERHVFFNTKTSRPRLVILLLTSARDFLTTCSSRISVAKCTVVSDCPYIVSRESFGYAVFPREPTEQAEACQTPISPLVSLSRPPISAGSQNNPPYCYYYVPSVVYDPRDPTHIMNSYTVLRPATRVATPSSSFLAPC